MTRATVGSHAQETKSRVHIPHDTRKNDSLYEHASEKVSSLFTEGKKAAMGAQDNFKEYRADLTASVRKHPLSSLLIAGGIGYILSTLFRK